VLHPQQASTNAPTINFFFMVVAPSKGTSRQNPKSEARNPKQISNLEFPNRKLAPLLRNCLLLRASSCFGFRASDFEFCSKPKGTSFPKRRALCGKSAARSRAFSI